MISWRITHARERALPPGPDIRSFVFFCILLLNMLKVEVVSVRS